MKGGAWFAVYLLLAVGFNVRQAFRALNPGEYRLRANLNQIGIVYHWLTGTYSMSAKKRSIFNHAGVVFFVLLRPIVVVYRRGSASNRENDDNAWYKKIADELRGRLYKREEILRIVQFMPPVPGISTSLFRQANHLELCLGDDAITQKTFRIVAANRLISLMHFEDHFLEEVFEFSMHGGIFYIRRVRALGGRGHQSEKHYEHESNIWRPLVDDEPIRQFLKMARADRFFQAARTEIILSNQDVT